MSHRRKVFTLFGAVFGQPNPSGQLGPGLPRPAAAAGTPEEKLNCYHRVRDQIKKFVQTLPAALAEKEASRDAGMQGKNREAEARIDADERRY